MKLDNFVSQNKLVDGKQSAVAIDTEITFESEVNPTVSISSKAPLNAPCNLCHRKVTQLFSLNQQGLIYFVCYSCYKMRYKNCSKVIKSFVDSSTLLVNPQPKVKWGDLCTTAEQLAPRMTKARKQNRKNKKV